mmetsp:Transcript_36307/g.83744  ORF Transcript_36307/g.83744 Transcript_36307/m.83744 type:complete len:252 (+) Transcript_36307:806-1561(+)
MLCFCRVKGGIAKNIQKQNCAKLPWEGCLVRSWFGSEHEQLQPYGLKECTQRGGIESMAVLVHRLASVAALVCNRQHHNQYDDRQGADELQSKDLRSSKARNVQESKPEAAALENDGCSIATTGRTCLNHSVAYNKIVDRLDHLVDSQRHRDTSIGIIALPLRLQLPKQLHVLARHTGRCLHEDIFSSEANVPLLCQAHLGQRRSLVGARLRGGAAGATGAARGGHRARFPLCFQFPFLCSLGTKRDTHHL